MWQLKNYTFACYSGALPYNHTEDKRRQPQVRG